MKVQTGRAIRVFLSSTFQDLQAEREYLVKNTFPAISKIAHQRNVDFAVVDLRWGVTEAEAQEGKVVEICLNEIEETRPFFIGIIGDRYGWCPLAADISGNERLQRRYPWVKECIDAGMSMTEIEMRFGVFMSEKPVMASFYLKDGSPSAATGHGNDEKLESLRAMVECKAAEGKCTAAHFSSTAQLGKQVYQDLLQLLDNLYPATETDAATVAADKQAYLTAQMRRVYYNSRSLSLLDETLQGMDTTRDRTVLIHSENGSGKSALASNWRIEDRQVIRVHLNQELCTGEAVWAFLRAEYTRRKLGEEKITCVIDGLEYLQSESDRRLEWLAGANSAGIDLILTTDDDVQERCVQALAMRDYRDFRTIRLYAPSEEETKEIIRGYLSHYAKGLTETQVSAIARFPLFENIYLLRLFLQEMVQFGSYEKLDSFIALYLHTRTREQLLYKIFGRLEGDYGLKAVQTFFALLTCSRIGLLEEDIQSATRLNNIDWAAFCEAVGLMIIRSNGRLSLHPQIRQAATERYLSEEETVKEERRLTTNLLDKERKTIRRGRLRERIAVEILWQYIMRNDLAGHVRKYGSIRTLFTLGDADEETSMAFRRIVATGKTEPLKVFLTPAVLCGIALFRWPRLMDSLCFVTLQGNSDELQALRQHISDSWAPFLVKLRLAKYIDSFEEKISQTEFAATEDTWVYFTPRNINIVDMGRLLLYEMPYLTAERINHIEEEADNLYQRAQSETGNEILIALLLGIKAHCRAIAGDYRTADDYFAIAVQTLPLLNQAHELRYIIASGLGDEAQCEAIREQAQSTEKTGK